jgi:hypothetical protein
MATISVRVAKAASALPRLRSVEAAKLLEHQMYFWGMDVLHAGGNLLVALGCIPLRREDAAHKVRCYAMNTPQGRVILHSTGVLLQPEDGAFGITYLRPTHRLYHVPPQVMPLPCASDKAIPADLQPVKASEFPSALARLLQFVRDYENRAAARLPARAREDAWREHRRTATHGIKWLPPADSRRWLDACLASAAGR